MMIILILIILLLLIIIIIIIINYYERSGILRHKAFQLVADLTKTCPQPEMNDHQPSLGGTCG